MKLGQLKNKIFAILGVDKSVDTGDLNYLIDSAQRKAATLGKFIVKRSGAALFKNGELNRDVLPEDFISAAGEKTYYAMPAQITDQTDDETELGYDGMMADITAYGVAMELCGKVYPSDVRKYMQIATEYDERVSSLCARPVAVVHNGMFGRRGI